MIYDDGDLVDIISSRLIAKVKHQSQILSNGLNKN